MSEGAEKFVCAFCQREDPEVVIYTAEPPKMVMVDICLDCFPRKRPPNTEGRLDVFMPGSLRLLVNALTRQGQRSPGAAAHRVLSRRRGGPRVQ